MVAKTTVGISFKLDKDHLQIRDDETAFRALANRLSEEDSLELSTEANRIYFKNRWTWDITKWTPFSAIDKGSIEITDAGDALFVNYELSIWRPFLLAIALSVATVIPFILGQGNFWVALGCLFPYWFIIFAVNGMLLLQITRFTLGHA